MSRRRIYTRSGVYAWSGAGLEGGGLLVADAAQQIDLSRETSSSFMDFVSTSDILGADASSQIKPTHSVPVDFKLNAIAWSPLQTEDHPQGLIIGGGESGLVSVFDAASLVKGGELKRIGETRYHQGHVSSVAVSPVNPKWVCSGGAMGVVILWDLNSPLNPMSPGHPNYTHQIKRLGWNRCAEHIVGSLTNERCSIWDLRKPGSSILDVGEIGNSVEWGCMQWNPVNGTTLCLASQSDAYPIVQKWDLRYASAPLFAYEPHTRGVFGMDWNAYDSDLMATVGRDERVLFHNPNNGQIVGRLSVQGWARSLSWNPTDPNLFAVSFFDRPLEVHSLTPFPTNDSQTQTSDTSQLELSVIPAWMKSGSCGVHFSYGNRICTFGVQPDPTTNTSVSVVYIKQVQGDKSLGEGVAQLQTALDTNQLSTYCEHCASRSENTAEKMLWTMLSKQTLNSSRYDYIQLLVSDEQGESNANGDLDIVLQKMDSCHLLNGEDSDDERSEEQPQTTSCIIAPLCFDDASQEDMGFVDSLCGGNARKAIATAVVRKEWTLALLLAASTDDQNLVRFIAMQVDSDASSCRRTRLSALMAAGLWEQLLSSWNVADWKRLLLLILSHAPPHRVRPLCSALCEKMNEGGLTLEASLPAAVAGDVESLMDATTALPALNRVSIAVVLRHSLGGGSSRAVRAGPKFQSAIEEFGRHLAEEGFVDEAWELVEAIDTEYCSKELSDLRHTLYNVRFSTSEPRNATVSVSDQFSGVREQYATLGHNAMQPSSGYGISARQCPRRPSVDQYSPGMTARPAPSYPGAMPPSPLTPKYHGQPVGMGGYSQGSPSAVAPGYAPSMASQPYAPQPLSSFSTNGYMAPSTANGYMPSNVYTNQPVSNTYITNQSLAQPPPPPAGAYGTLPSSAARFRTISTTSQSSVTRSLTKTPTGELTKDSQTAGRKSSGWNDPPVIASKRTEVQSRVADIQWKPAPVQPYTGFNPAHTAQQPPAPFLPSAQPSYTLSEADTYLVTTINNLVANIRSNNNTPMVTHKMADVEHKVANELTPRLARGSFSQYTLQQLYRMAQLMTWGDFHSCQIICNELVRGSDFVELSPVVPALKSLTATAYQIYRR